MACVMSAAAVGRRYIRPAPLPVGRQLPAGSRLAPSVRGHTQDADHDPAGRTHPR